MSGALLFFDFLATRFFLVIPIKIFKEKRKPFLTYRRQKRLKLGQYFLEDMLNGIFWRIENHSRPNPTHNLANLSAFLWSITMRWTIFARRFLLAITAMVEAAAGKISQMLIFFGQCILMQSVATIQVYHFADNLLFIFNSAHFLLLSFLFYILPLQSHKNCA